jgi:AcrR family transcriptional regulator
VPKEVDHPARRRELADAACRVIARNGLAGTTLAHVAEESGWSIGSIRDYFPNKDELVASALWRVGERVDDRIGHRTAGNDDERPADRCYRAVPLDMTGARWPVYLAFLAQAAVVPALTDSRGAQRPQSRSQRDRPSGTVASCRCTLTLRSGVPWATRRADPPAHYHPRQTPASWALAILDDHLTALAVPPAANRHPHDSRTQRR